jgi:hypothetical protein
VRLSITLDDDLYAIAKSLAKADDCSLSAAVNRLLRRAITQPRASAAGAAPSSFPVSPGRRLITEDEVRALDDEA